MENRSRMAVKGLLHQQKTKTFLEKEQPAVSRAIKLPIQGKSCCLVKGNSKLEILQDTQSPCLGPEFLVCWDTQVHTYYTFPPTSSCGLNSQLCWCPSQQNSSQHKTGLGKIVFSVEVHVEAQTKETSVKHKQEFNFQNLVGCK